LNWGLLGYGIDMTLVTQIQMKYFNSINIQKEVGKEGFSNSILGVTRCPLHKPVHSDHYSVGF